MSDKSQSDQDQSKSIFDSDIGDDWGEAFEDDDFSADSDEPSSEFFLEDEFEDTISSDQAQTGADDAASDIDEKEGTSLKFSGNTLFSKYAGIIFQAFEKAKCRFLSLPLIYRIPTAAAIVVILISTALILKPSEDIPDKIPETAQTTKEAAPQKQSPEKIAELDAIVAQESPEEKVRKKWTFPSFLISANDNLQGDDIFFVEVDITLILLLDENEEVPEEKSVQLRDMIYQFYSNRPLYELRRYSLARGEMNRKLRSWIEKQWPDNKISAIVFNRYQLI